MFAKPVRIVFLLAAVSKSAHVGAADLPAGATVLDADAIWDIANPQCFAISPDGKQIAYISKGALWACRVDAGPPTKLADLPNTVTAILAEAGNEKQREQSAASPHARRYRALFGPAHVDMYYVFSVAWTPNQDGVTYAVRKRVRENSPVAAYHVMHASLTGSVNEIAVIEGDFGTPWEYQIAFHVTADRKFVIVSAYQPLIWDVVAARPRVTPYDVLAPSAKSNRYLGIEIDTRQLVLIDAKFEILRRFDVAFPAEEVVKLNWSKDDRFGICRTMEADLRSELSAFRIDLETGEQSPLDENSVREALGLPDEIVSGSGASRYFPIAVADGGRRLIARSGPSLFCLAIPAAGEDEAKDDK